MKAYAHLIHYALHTPYNLRQRHYSRLIGSRTTPRQSAAIRESIVSPVATGGRHKHPPSPQSHARALRCGLAQACAAARCALRADVIMWVVSGGPGSRLPGDRAYGVMPNKLLYTSVTRGSSRQSGQCQAEGRWRCVPQPPPTPVGRRRRHDRKLLSMLLSNREKNGSDRVLPG